MTGIEGGFDSKEPEYEVTYSIVVLPEFISLPFPSVELPEKVDSATELEILDSLQFRTLVRALFVAQLLNLERLQVCLEIW